MKTTYNKREIAQRERAKNLSIYNEADAVAKEVLKRRDRQTGRDRGGEGAEARV